MEVRSLEPGEATSILEFADGLPVAAPLRTLSEAQVIALESGRGVGLVGEVAGEIVAFAGMFESTVAGEWTVEALARDDGYAVALLANVLGYRVAHATSLRWWVYDQSAFHLPPRLGFNPERALLRMGRPLPPDGPPAFPPAVTVRAFRPGLDESPWLAINNAAFAGHPENGGWTMADLAQRTSLDWFSNEGFRMAWLDDELVGFCWTKIDDPMQGEIYVIAVSPPHAGKGLGRELVREGMRHLWEAGCRRVFLYTDEENLPAVNLYAGLGYEVERRHRAFVKDLRQT